VRQRRRSTSTRGDGWPIRASSVGRTTRIRTRFRCRRASSHDARRATV
jgi:hypothetical protein